ncbi:hypothetical protein [Martelella soudanensis]|uniref:hypothetical protein n=1 Tax=unclassified Martelella TaxID=2629616 RepID=UPI0015DD8B29|nr:MULTISPECIES: hypothetical protein [unclassified Martelella]
MKNRDTSRSEENHSPEGMMMKEDDLLDLIEIALQLAMRLGLAETASHLFLACDTLSPAETEAPQWGESSNISTADSPSMNTSD